MTIAGDTNRDRCVQSCMRMRQLGHSQQIHFWASYEADMGLREKCKLTINDRVTNAHVFKFITCNSHQFETSSMVHWAANALNYTKKQVAYMLFERPPDEKIERLVSMKNLYNACVYTESVPLSKTYAGSKKSQQLTTIVAKKMNDIENPYVLDKEISTFVHDLRYCVVHKVNKKASKVLQFWHVLDNEQQTELQYEQEQEFEEQREIERALEIKPEKPMFNKKLQSIVLNGVVDETKLEQLLYPISDSLLNTQLYEFCENNKNAWAPHLFVSKDFKSVIKSGAKYLDDYLRPVMWIARIKNKYDADREILVFLSPFFFFICCLTFGKVNMPHS